MDAWDLVRVANIVLATWLLGVCMMRIVRDWGHWTHRERVVRVHLAAYLLVIAYGTTEALAADVEPGARIGLVLACHVSFAVALWRTRHDPVR